MKAIKIAFFLLPLLVIYSCQPKSDKSGEDMEGTALKEEFKKLLPGFPTAMDFAAHLQATGADFNPAFLNDTAKASAYVLVTGKSAANLGVYMYDLGYTIAYKEKDYFNSYYNTCSYLSNSLGVDKTFLNVLKTRYQANLESNDSLRAQFEQLYGQSSNSIAYGDDTRKVLRTLFLSGFYIEGLYSMFEIIENYPKDILPDDQRVMILIPVAKAILSQEDNIVNLHEMLKENVYEKFDSQSFQFWFEDLIKTYQKLDVQAKIMNNQGGELLNDQVFNELKEKVEVIRTQIVAKP